MSEKLSNCPWCGSDHVEPDYGVFAVHPKTWGSGRMVSTGCLDCGASGPEKINIQESSDAWNLFCAKLNRLAALEKTCGEIVKSAPQSENELEQMREMYINGDLKTDVRYAHYGQEAQQFIIAQKLKAVLEEA